MEPVDSGTSAAPTGFEREVSDSSVEYLLFILDSKADGRGILSQLEALRKAALKLCVDVTKDYIWQRDEFNLELKNEEGESVACAA